MTDTGALRGMRHADADPAGLSRRTVLKAGAWAAPVIAVAAAVPAASASIIEKLRFTNFSVWFIWDTSGHRTGIAGNTTVWLEGDPGAQAGPVTLRITVPAAGMSATAVADSSSTGWAAQEGVVSGELITYTLIWTGTLIAPGSAHTSSLQFQLLGEDEADLVPPIGWSAVALANGAASAGAAGTLQQYLVPTADPAELLVVPGALTGNGNTLNWTGASITYSGASTATVPYFVELHGPNGRLASFENPDATIANGTAVTLDRSYDAADVGAPFAPGDYWVSLSVVAKNAVIEAKTPDFTVTA